METEYDYGLGGMKSTKEEVENYASDSDRYNEKKNLYKDMLWIKEKDTHCSDAEDNAAGETIGGVSVTDMSGAGFCRDADVETANYSKVCENDNDKVDDEEDDHGFVEEQFDYTYDSESELDQYSIDDTNAIGEEKCDATTDGMSSGLDLPSARDKHSKEGQEFTIELRKKSEKNTQSSIKELRPSKKPKRTYGDNESFAQKRMLG